MTKFVTFSVDCTYTLDVDLDDGDCSYDEICKAAWEKLQRITVNTGDLENADWEIQQID